MNKSQRGPWVALTESGWVLCAFCQYRQWLEDDCCCQHPLEAVREPRTSNIMEPGDDCWGFHPSPGDTVAAAAIRLQEWQALEHGQRIVAERERDALQVQLTRHVDWLNERNSQVDALRVRIVELEAEKAANCGRFPIIQTIRTPDLVIEEDCP